MIFDCVTYSNNYQDLVLELRLNTLDKYVDKFVIVEATLDHAGNQKRLNFNINKFEKFKKKIRYIVVNDMPKNTESFYYNKSYWHKNIVRDEYQRNQIMRGLYDIKENDLVIISDCDEIPNLERLSEVKIKKFAVFNQKNYKYKFNLLCDNQTAHQGSRVIKAKYLSKKVTPQWLRYQYTKRIKFWQIHRLITNPMVIENGGWHFSFALSPENIKSKMESYAHGELITKKNTDINFIKEIIEKRVDIFSNGKLTKVELDSTFPEYILKNKEKFREFIL